MASGIQGSSVYSLQCELDQLDYPIKTAEARHEGTQAYKTQYAKVFNWSINHRDFPTDIKIFDCLGLALLGYCNSNAIGKPCDYSHNIATKMAISKVNELKIRILDLQRQVPRPASYSATPSPVLSPPSGESDEEALAHGTALAISCVEALGLDESIED